jgi:hypothetical protein
MVNADDSAAYSDQLEGGRTTAVLGDLADLNADVRGDALNYRDPAIAVPQDKATGMAMLYCCTVSHSERL